MAYPNLGSAKDPIRAWSTQSYELSDVRRVGSFSKQGLSLLILSLILYNMASWLVTLFGATILSHANSSPAPRAPPAVLQPTPPMGFNDWSAFMCGLNESIFVETANAMVKNGLLGAGYNRINLDDCWSTMERAENGSMQWDPEKFPHGLPWLTRYLKNLGFLPGIYTDAGNLSCGGYPGAYGHEALDAKTFADWGFTYLKLDGCNMPIATEPEYKKVYGHWHEILSNMSSPMVFSESAPAYFAEEDNLTDWYSVMDWVPQYGQLARHSRDTLVFNSTKYWPNITGWDSVLFNYGQEVRLARYQKPGYFNDPDFLNVDHFDYTLDEKKSHFALWASLSAPLIISAWIPGFDAEEIKYLTNKDIVAVNQDPLALQATLVSQDGTWDVLTKNLANGDRLLTILNRGSVASNYSVSFERLGLSVSDIMEVRDLWTGKTSIFHGYVEANIPSHGTAIFRVAAPGNVIPTGMIFNTYSLHTLTSTSKWLRWANSTADDGQVWLAMDDGSITSLADEDTCLTDVGRGNVAMKECTTDSTNQQWDYLYTGNVRSRSSRLCLTEGWKGAVRLEKCLFETNSQVFGLPSGVTILQS